LHIARRGLMALDTELLRRRIEFFFSGKQWIHVVFTNGRFYNGPICANEKGCAEVGGDFFFVDDMKLGKTIVFFAEVDAILPYREKEEGK